ncbi:hypothetical protein VIGAN_07001900 [Vigna angularis var. angularis]|uniref:Uncharacterized protein n=1 Tax=Vigna angularis var. angularis TaxID=157739 RepID=A0A0S3SEZ1_PHAAN|nr:hypothetical protein VIGAN_07001900 [Vigna angularis var. angularis]
MSKSKSYLMMNQLNLNFLNGTYSVFVLSSIYPVSPILHYPSSNSLCLLGYLQVFSTQSPTTQGKIYHLFNNKWYTKSVRNQELKRERKKKV